MESPKMVYLARGVARLEEKRGNIIRGNRISGHGMKAHCIAFGPGVSAAANTLESDTGARHKSGKMYGQRGGRP